jgi:acetyltransferase-like isoleucine patch superfamily enzyme
LRFDVRLFSLGKPWVYALGSYGQRGRRFERSKSPLALIVHWPRELKRFILRLRYSLLKIFFREKRNAVEFSSNAPYLKSYFDQHYPGMGYEAGDYSYGTPHILEWGEGRKLYVGKYCSIGPETVIYLGGNHRSDWVTTFPFTALDPLAAGIGGHPLSRGDVVIGHDVWMGRASSILSGVTVGHGACIAAHAVVTKDVPPYAIVAGNPAKVVRYRFSERQIEKLLEIRWWDFSIEKIRDLYPKLLSSSIDEFISDAEKQKR